MLETSTYFHYDHEKAWIILPWIKGDLGGGTQTTSPEPMVVGDSTDSEVYGHVPLFGWTAMGKTALLGDFLLKNVQSHSNHEKTADKPKSKDIVQNTVPD